MSAKVSTIIPVYNGERTIAQAIDSALAQDYDDHEIIVVNDGSTDSTATILEKYGGQIQVVTQPNGGLSVARNAALRRATGKYIALLDSDDVWLFNKLTTMVSALESHPTASLAFSEAFFIDKDGLPSGESSLGRAPSIDDLVMPRPLPIFPSTWVLSRETLSRVGGFCEKFKGAGGFDDTWLLFPLRDLGEFVYVPKQLALYRVYDFVAEDKYGPGLPIFISLLKQRYGPRAKDWIRNTKHCQCSGLLSKVARQMNHGDRLGALRTLLHIFWLWPTYFLRREFLSRLMSPQNARRFRQMISILPRTRSS